MDGEAITIEPKEMFMTVRVSLLPEDDARNGRFENIARPSKLKSGRGLYKNERGCFTLCNGRNAAKKDLVCT